MIVLDTEFTSSHESKLLSPAMANTDGTRELPDPETAAWANR
jgi:hypothetical protein